MKYRICRISQNFQPDCDGLSRHVYNISRVQAAMGNEILLLQPFAGYRQEGGINFVKVAPWLAGSRLGYKLRTALFCLACIPAAIRLKRKTDFDIIHCHGDVIEGFIFGLLKKILGVPLVMTVHGGLNKGRLYRAVAPFCFSFVNTLVPISRAVSDDLIRLGVPLEKIKVISTGLDYKSFTEMVSLQKDSVRRELGIKTDLTLVVSVGRFHPVKGFEYLIEAATRFSSQKEVSFCIIGDGPEADRLKRKAGGLKNLTLTGKRTHEEVLKYLRAADIFVLSSVDLDRQSEAIPTALIEAMAMGLPVVATDAGESKYLLENGLNGYIVKQRDADGLCAALKDMMSKIGDAEARGRIFEHNRDIGRQRDWGAIAEEMGRLYFKVLS